MSERKVLNKYYPPDFDPSKIPKGKRNRNATFNIRIMAPFNMRCNTCKDYIYKGKKFNSRKEDVMDEDYLGLKIFRFYIKCPRCVSEIAFKTDLQNTDYTLEAGATRLFEAEKIAQKMAEQERKEKEEDEMNPMKLLENRTKASRMEMEQIDALEELRELNSRKNVFNTDEMIEKYRKYEETLQQLQMEQEEKEIQDIFGAGSTKVVKRLHDSDSEDEGPAEKKVATEPAQPVKPTDILSEVKKETKARPQQSWEKSVGSMTTKTSLKGLIVKKKTTTLPVVISKPKSDNIQSVSDLESSLHNVMKTSDPISVNTNTAVNSAVDKVKMAGSDRTDQNSESGEKETKNSSNSAEVAQPKSVGLGGLGLLGNYSDSESDVSE